MLTLTGFFSVVFTIGYVYIRLADPFKRADVRRAARLAAGRACQSADHLSRSNKHE